MNLMRTPSLFSTLAIGRIPAYLNAKPQETDRQREGAIQMAITDSVRERSSGDLRTAKGAACFEGIRHQRQPLDGSLTSSDGRGL
jgi:ribosomal protein S13